MDRSRDRGEAGRHGRVAGERPRSPIHGRGPARSLGGRRHRYGYFDRGARLGSSWSRGHRAREDSGAARHRRVAAPDCIRAPGRSFRSPGRQPHEREPPDAGGLSLESARSELHRPGSRSVPHLQHDLSVGGPPPSRDRDRASARRRPLRYLLHSLARLRSSVLPARPPIAARAADGRRLRSPDLVTVESLYVSSRPAPIEITPESVALALIVGLTVTVAAALSPALEAARVTPVEAMSRGRREYVAGVHKTRDLIFAAVLGAGGALASRGRPVGGKPLFGYLAALLLIGCSAFAIPALVSALSRLSSRLLQTLLGVEALLASRSLAASLRRTSVLVGALSTAIAMMTAVGIMVGSFRQTVLIWMDDRLQADLYLRPAGSAVADRHPTMSTRELRRASPPPRSRSRERSARMRSVTPACRSRSARATSPCGRSTRAPLPLRRSRPKPLPELVGRDTVMVSEPFANKHDVRPATALRCLSATRTPDISWLDVYYDYANERGYILVDRATLLKYLPDPAVRPT